MPLILNPQAIRRLAFMGTRHHLDLGGDAPDPDPAIGEAAKANSAIAGRMQDLAERTYDDQQAILREFMPVLRDAITKSAAASDLSTSRSNDAWADYNATWKPVEQKLAAESLAAGSPGRLEQEAQRAGGMAKSQLDQALTENERQLQMAGASPEKIAALQASARVAGAKGIAGAEYAGRKAQESTSMAYLDNAARFGRNMTSTGLETARLAGAQTGQAQGGVGGLQSAVAAPAASAGGLLGGAVGANNAAGSLYLQQYNAKAQADAADNGIFGDILGAGAGLLGMSKSSSGMGLGSIAGFFSSSEKLKDMGDEVTGDEASAAVERSPSKRWAYKPGLGDGSTKQRMGPTAESLAAVAPEVSDGTQVDGIAMLGLHHAAIGGQHARLARIEKRLGLADARRG